MSELPTDAPSPAARRPIERDALYNPAFIALILAQAAIGHKKRASAPMPLSLAFLAAPIVLHGPTRQALPRQARSKMGAWLELHPVLRAGLGGRAASLVPAVRAGLRHGLRSGALNLGPAGLAASKPKLSGAGVELSTEVDEILKRSEYVGGWFALSGAPSGIYALWRVKP